MTGEKIKFWNDHEHHDFTHMKSKRDATDWQEKFLRSP